MSRLRQMLGCTGYVPAQPIAVIGLGKLGLATAAYFLDQGFEVYGYDSDENVRRRLQAGLRALRVGEKIEESLGRGEPGVHNTIAKNTDGFVVTDTADQAAEKAEIISIIVPTPSLEGGSFSNEYLKAVLEEIAPAVKRSLTWKCVNVISTVMPGSCESVLIPYLENLTEKRCGPPLDDDASGRETFGFTYNPEFIALGQILDDLRGAPFVLIGAKDGLSAAATASLYRERTAHPPVFPPKGEFLGERGRFKVVSFIDAELAKLSLNFGVTLKISFANAVGLLCSGTPGANVDKVLEVVGSDSRIGRRYLKAGLGFGGPCFPRDVVAWRLAVEETGEYYADAEWLDGSLFQQVMNDAVHMWAMIRLRLDAAGKKRVVILGASYKPGTHVTEASQSLAFGEEMSRLGKEVFYYDPAVESLHAGMKAFVGADLVVVATNDPKWLRLPWDDYIEDVLAEGAVVLDYWRLLAGHVWKRVKYVPFGIGPGVPAAPAEPEKEGDTK